MRFVRTPGYRRDLKDLRLTEAEAATIEGLIARDPSGGDLVVGLAGVRKMRFPLRGRGKSGGGRVIYLLLLADDTAILLMAYAKSQKADLSPEDRKALLALVRELKG